MDQINCPFCGWHRWRDTKKGAPDFNPTVARIALARHIKEYHRYEMEELVLEWNKENVTEPTG